MGNIKGQHQFPEQVYLWEETDPVQGGDEGIDNVPIKQLANRTQYLGDLSLKTFRDIFDKDPIGSFGMGFTLSSADQAVYDEDSKTWYEWLGNIPKVVAPGRLPAESGGIYNENTNPTGLWKGLSASSNKIMLSQGGSIQDSLDNFVDVVQFKHLNTSDDDWGPAFRAALKYAESKGIPYVHFSGNLKISSTDSVGWTLPFDDGTVSPERVANGQDSVLAPENKLTMPVYLNVPYGVGIKSDGYLSNSITFEWDRDTGGVDLNQPIAMCCRVKGWDGSYTASSSAVNRMSSVTSSNFDGFTITAAFMGIVSDGVTQWNKWGTVRFQRCGFGVLQQGSDIAFYDTLIFNGTYVGMCLGGWWLQRNAGAYPSSMLPPYPAKDTFASGWIDAVQIKELQYDFPLRTWNDRFKSFDTFFDTYFYKSSNNSTRLTSKLNDLTTDALTSFNKDPFRGVSTRAFSAISRYQHTTKSVTIGFLKTLGTFRPPVLTSSTVGGGCNIRKAYVERVGWLDPNEKTTDFFSSGVDVWNADITSLPASCVQGVMGVDVCTPVHTKSVKASTLGAVRFNDVIETQRFITGESGSIRLFRAATWDDTNGFKSCYEVKSDYVYTPLLTFESSGISRTGAKGFKHRSYSTAAYTPPFLTNGVANSSQAVQFRTAKISSVQTGRTVKAYFFLWFDNYSTLTNAMYISLSSLPAFRISGTSPLPDPNDDWVGPSGIGLTLYKVSSGVNVIPVSAGFVYSSDSERYLVLYSDVKKTTPIKPSDFTQGSVLEFCIEYPSASDWS